MSFKATSLELEQRMITKFSTFAVAVVLALLPAFAWAQTPSESDRYLYGPHMMWWGAGWYGMILGPFLMILMIAVVIAAAILLVRWIGTPWPGSRH
jgi:putative membrane protein